MKLIDKDAVVAEIEKTYKFHEKRGNEHDSSICDVLYGLSHRINTLEVKEVPIWEKVSPDTGQTTLYKDGGKSYLERFGYRIDLKDLDKLPRRIV